MWAVDCCCWLQHRLWQAHKEHGNGAQHRPGGLTSLSVLTPIKADMVIGFEPISYLKRLRKVLDALQAARQNVRESELRPPFFPAAIGRFGIIHHFR